MTPNKPLTPDSACTCAEGKGCPLHAVRPEPPKKKWWQKVVDSVGEALGETLFGGKR